MNWHINVVPKSKQNPEKMNRNLQKYMSLWEFSIDVRYHINAT